MLPKETRMEERALKRARAWNAAEKPHYVRCLRCDLACEVVMGKNNGVYRLETCPIRDKGARKFPYKEKEVE